nr:SCO family protein [Melioribacteraceae bacterium]
MMKYSIIFLLILFYSAMFSQTKQIDVGIDEKLNTYLPKDAEFINSDGELVTIDKIINKPTILSLVYFECPGICSPLLSELSHTIEKVDLVAGIDYQIISLSFNDREDFRLANKWKNIYLSGMKKQIDPKAWIFLTGDSLNIKKLTNSVGFYFKPYNKDFVHAAALIAISPNKKITRYIFGTSFNPFDVKMALIEAKSGKSNPTISKVLEFCYSYDPAGREYKLNV